MSTLVEITVTWDAWDTGKVTEAEAGVVEDLAKAWTRPPISGEEAVMRLLDAKGTLLELRVSDPLLVRAHVYERAPKSSNNCFLLWSRRHRAWPSAFKTRECIAQKGWGMRCVSLNRKGAGRRLLRPRRLTAGKGLRRAPYFLAWPPA